MQLQFENLHDNEFYQDAICTGYFTDTDLAMLITMAAHDEVHPLVLLTNLIRREYNDRQDSE